MAHYDIYREQLAALHHGHALWEPDPAGLYDQVAVGDVGYVRQGHFHRLFNVLLPADDPSHDLLGVPEGFETLHVGSRHLRTLALPKGDYHSFSVTASDVAVGVQIAAGPAPAAGNFQASFSCSKKQGAVLSLPFDARREDTFRKGDFRAYIATHCECWFTFAQDRGLDIERMEELILVTGCDRTQPWALAAFTSTSFSASIAFDVSVLSGALSAPTLRWKVAQQNGHSVPYNYGPRLGQEPRENQCIFIRGYRAKKRPLQLWPSKLLAAAEPRPDDCDPRDDDEQSPCVDAEDISGTPFCRDPLDPVLDFLLEQCSQAETAVVHDDDLMYIRGVDVLTADSVRTFLRDSVHRQVNICPNQAVVELSNILGGGDDTGSANSSVQVDITGELPLHDSPMQTESHTLPPPPNPRRSIMHRRNVSAPTPIYIDPSWIYAHKPRSPQGSREKCLSHHTQLIPPLSTPTFASTLQPSVPQRTSRRAIPRSLPRIPWRRPAIPSCRSVYSDAPPPYGTHHAHNVILSPAPASREKAQRPRGPRTRATKAASTDMRSGSSAQSSPVTDTMGVLESPDPPMSIFVTEPIALKGLTLEAAHWTLSPACTQSIISRAVRQSADTSSLRLLQPSVANGKLPQELLRLDARERALKEQHLSYARRRDALFNSLLVKPDAGVDALNRRLRGLQAASEDMDRIAAELYRVHDQAAQLRQLSEVHSRSALSLALRMINASALQSTTEAQTLRSKVAAHEAIAHEVPDPQAVRTVTGATQASTAPVPSPWQPKRRGTWST